MSLIVHAASPQALRPEQLTAQIPTEQTWLPHLEDQARALAERLSRSLLRSPTLDFPDFVEPDAVEPLRQFQEAQQARRNPPSETETQPSSSPKHQFQQQHYCHHHHRQHITWLD